MAFYKNKGLEMPKRCKTCREMRRQVWQEQQGIVEREENEKNIESFCIENGYCSVHINDIHISNPQKALFVLGNGFDLVHGVKSSYYNFRDTLGKNNNLRLYLETYLDVDDIWADFEEGLAHIRSSDMLNSLDDFMIDFDAYDPDAQIADMYIAADMASQPVQVIMEDLPRRFRQWVESLRLSSDNEPLKNLIRMESIYLNFNYTEFVETLYGVAEDKVCYVHGSRKRRTGFPKEELILGHTPGAGDSDEQPDIRIPNWRSKQKSEKYFAAEEAVYERINWYDSATTKNCKDIIIQHEEFFAGLGSIETMIVIGHSLSSVDWDYFMEIKKQNSNPNEMEWFFSCHSISNLKKIQRFVDAMKIRSEKVTIFAM